MPRKPKISTECRYCKTCNKKLIDRKGIAGPKQKYCSLACASEEARRRAKLWNKLNKCKQRAACPTCGQVKRMKIVTRLPIVG